MTNTTDYIKEQSRVVGFSHRHQYPIDRVHAKHCVDFLRATRRFTEGDTFCDFGGNDGTAAEELRVTTGSNVICYDILENRAELGRKAYPEVRFIVGELENITLPDKSVDWGFTIQTLEHTRNIMRVVNELERVCRKGIYVAVPLEDCESFIEDPAHHLHTTDWRQWVRWFVNNDTEFRLADWSKTFNQGMANQHNATSSGPEVVYVFTLPEDPQYDNYHLLRWYEDLDTTHIEDCDG